MDDELPIEYTRILDDTVFQRDRTAPKFKLVEFYIGKYGAFTERIPDDDNFHLELARRAEALRTKLRTFPR
jgi:hypothetical protein